MITCTFKLNDFFKRKLDKSIHGKLDMHKFMHIFFLIFACATIIGDNVDTEKSAIFMLNS